MVGQQTLDLFILVRIQARQPKISFNNIYAQVVKLGADYEPACDPPVGGETGRKHAVLP